MCVFPLDYIPSPHLGTLDVELHVEVLPAITDACGYMGDDEAPNLLRAPGFRLRHWTGLLG